MPAAGQVLCPADGALKVQRAAYGAALLCVLAGALLRWRFAPADGGGGADSTVLGKQRAALSGDLA
ncbi:hypothetical protein [Kitasatospora nipponensis]|uniref:hypothetical protein n=1 Tax=Kitasatospora nipponensis TaxID=258049 RepID=UPI0031DAFB08